MYECDAKYGPPEKYPEGSLQYCMLRMYRQSEREHRGCEAVGESHEYVSESRSTIAILDANKKVIGDVTEALYDGSARFSAPAIRYTGRTICRHCKRRK